MTDDHIGPSGGLGLVLRYALIPVHGYDIAVMTTARMLDPDGSGATARILPAGQPVPLGAQPVLLASTTAYAMVGVEWMLKAWHTGVPRPWLVLISDVPADPAPAARYRIRALQARLAGVAQVPYLPVLRTVAGPEEAMQHQDVMRAATKLRRQLEGDK